MKTLSFGCKPNDNVYLEQIFPALLNKIKKQTIRPAWKELEPINDEKIVGLKKVIADKQSRFKVGEKIRLYWKQRGKYKWFCRLCGDPLIPIKSALKCKNEHVIIQKEILEKIKSNPSELKLYNIFNKILGEVEITKVFEIMLHKKDLKNGTHALKIMPLRSAMLFGERQNIVTRDGFKSTEDMFDYFGKNCDLNSPKKFYVYRWKWVS